jgi:hypothetical protein
MDRGDRADPTHPSLLPTSFNGRTDPAVRAYEQALRPVGGWLLRLRTDSPSDWIRVLGQRVAQ